MIDLALESPRINVIILVRVKQTEGGMDIAPKILAVFPEIVQQANDFPGKRQIKLFRVLFRANRYPLQVSTQCLPRPILPDMRDEITAVD